MNQICSAQWYVRVICEGMKLHISHLDIVLISCLKNLYSHMAYLGNVTDGIIQAGFGKTRIKWGRLWIRHLSECKLFAERGAGPLSNAMRHTRHKRVKLVYFKVLFNYQIYNVLQWLELLQYTNYRWTWYGQISQYDSCCASPPRLQSKITSQATWCVGERANLTKSTISQKTKRKADALAPKFLTVLAGDPPLNWLKQSLHLKFHLVEALIVF